MAPTDGPKSPTRRTLNQLFAVSSNLCAFPKCTTALVDLNSGSTVGEVCHIKGAKPDAARYDSGQLNEERHAYDNLILLCNVHHKIVDDDEESYTVDRLLTMKQQHEVSNTDFMPVDDDTAERFISVAIDKSTIQDSVITSHGQTGGQTAHTIHNYHSTPNDRLPLQLEANVDHAGDLNLFRTFGCPGMRVSIVCRSNRPGKIQTVHLRIDDVDVMDGLQKGFGAEFGYTPLEGSTQTMDVELIPITKPNSEEGFVVNQDEVARFFYPLPIPPTSLALRTKPSNLSIAVRFFDDSEEILLTGQTIQDVLHGVFNVHQNRPGHLVKPININVKVISTKPPGPEMGDLIGKVNPNTIPFDRPDATT